MSAKATKDLMVASCALAIQGSIQSLVTLTSPCYLMFHRVHFIVWYHSIVHCDCHTVRQASVDYILSPLIEKAMKCYYKNKKGVTPEEGGGVRPEGQGGMTPKGQEGVRPERQREMTPEDQREEKE